MIKRESLISILTYAALPLKRLRKGSPAKLEFGCGPNLTHGYEGVDIRWFNGIRYICNAWEIDKYVKKGSVEEIYSRHFLEHLTFHQAELTIKAWSRILKPKGTLRIIIPDMDYHICQFKLENEMLQSEANPEWTVLQHAIAGFWGWQREGDTKYWDIHKSGYNFNMLSSWLTKNGYTNVEHVDDKPWNLNVRAIRL